MTIDLPKHLPAEISNLACCLGCRLPLEGRDRCIGCGREYPVVSNVLHAIDELKGNNQITAAFYDGPGWKKFRFWERLFLQLVGGHVPARTEILKHLPKVADAKILEVGIGDGDNVPLLPGECEIFGVDTSRVQLDACLQRFPSLSGRLAWAEGEHLPFPDASFDASYSIGGFNYFSNPEAALREMRRVTKPGRPVIVADERPDLKRFGLGHLIGWKSYDIWWMRRVGLPDDFIAMVFANELNPASLVKDACPDAIRVAIWRKLGYCLIDPAPSRRLIP